MRRQVDHHLARARAIATGSILGARTDVLPVLRDLERTLGRIYADKALAIEVGAAARAGVSRRAPGPGGDARQPAGQRVQVGGGQRDRAGRGRGRAGLGSRSRTTGRACRPRAVPRSWRGRRLDEQMPGTGLGLAIVADLAQLYGGRLVLDATAAGGLRAVLVLPMAETLTTSPRVLEVHPRDGGSGARPTAAFPGRIAAAGIRHGRRAIVRADCFVCHHACLRSSFNIGCRPPDRSVLQGNPACLPPSTGCTTSRRSAARRSATSTSTPRCWACASSSAPSTSTTRASITCITATRPARPARR